MFDAVWFYKYIIEIIFILDHGVFDRIRTLSDRTGNGYLTDDLPARTIPSFKLEPVPKGRLDLAGERGFKSPSVSPRVIYAPIPKPPPWCCVPVKTPDQ
jgi:hypothetical protein